VRKSSYYAWVCQTRWCEAREGGEAEEQVLLMFARLPNEKYPYRMPAERHALLSAAI
jgi:hypothetical protein